MLVLVTGGSKCGKSRIAEAMITKYQNKRYYIATMEPYGDEAENAIKRHQSMRAGKGFETIERYTDMGGIQLPFTGGQPASDAGTGVKECAVLLECMGNLCANEMFSPQGIHEGVAEKILSDMDKLYRQTEVLVIVTSQVGADGVVYPPETMEYMRILGDINASLAAKADMVIEAVFGIPVLQKGSELWQEIYNQESMADVMQG